MIQCNNQSSQQKEYANRQMHGRPAIKQKSFIFASFLLLDVRRHFCSQSIFDQRRLGKKVLILISNECLIISIVAFLINKVPSHHELLLA